MIEVEDLEVVGGEGGKEGWGEKEGKNKDEIGRMGMGEEVNGVGDSVGREKGGDDVVLGKGGVELVRMGEVEG